MTSFASLVVFAVFALLAAPIASAATRSMVGSLGVVNPDIASPRSVDAGPLAFGKAAGPHPPSEGPKTITLAGATVGTFVGRRLTLPAGRLAFAGGGFRDFSGFDAVAQVTKTFMSDHDAATFRVGGGALAVCPGPGCSASGAGTAISFCPPLAPDPLHPAPGTAMAPIGNWNCVGFAVAGPGRRGIRLGINRNAAARYGGTLRLLRNQRATIWRVLEDPATPMAPAVVERAWRAGIHELAAGRTNFAFRALPENPGPRLFARLDARGAVTATSGCTRATGTIGIGKTFMRPGPSGPFAPITGPGNACGTAPAPAPSAAAQSWGFRMTTGALSGSDFFPFLDVRSTLGTPFRPQIAQRSFGQGFYFTRQGDDRITPLGHRNLALVGGGIAYDPKSGDAFFRVLDLRLRILTPEPQGASLLAVGGLALGFFACTRWPNRAAARARRRPTPHRPDQSPRSPA